jgi:Mn-dependent DtxR family transcriptional regulator
VHGRVAVLVEEGRNVGIGVTLVTQRSARLNKDVAELADCMIAFRIVGPNSMRAVLDWLGEHVEKARLKEIGEKLRSLPRGSALVVSPGLARVRGHRRDAQALDVRLVGDAEAGKEVRASGRREADLEKYRERMAEVVERKARALKANDPKALKARRCRRARAKQLDDLNADWTAAADDAFEKLKDVIEAAEAKSVEMRENAAMIRSAIAPSPAAMTKPAIATPAIAAPKKAATKPVPTTAGFPASSTLVPAQQRIVDTIATMEAIGVAPTRKTVAAWLGMHPNTKGFVNNMGALRSAGLVEEFALTDAGRNKAQTTVPNTHAEVREILLRPLKPAQRKIVEAVEQLGRADRNELAELLGVHPNTKGFVNNVGALRGRALLTEGWPITLEDVFRGATA